jgi:hypothetical protein
LGKSSRAHGFAASIICASRKLRPTPEVAPYQRVGQGPAGKTAKKIKKNTFKAGMCLKTNKSWTNCQKTFGHLCLRFGHLRLTNTNFAGKSGLVAAIW